MRQKLSGCGSVVGSLLLLSLSGCTSMEVKTEQAPGADLGRYRSYAWVKPPETSAPQASILDQSVKSDVDQQLAMKGLKEVDPGSAQVLVSYSARSADSFEYGGGPLFYGGAYPVREGDLTIYFADPKTKKVVWQGSAAGVISEAGESQNQVADAIHDILQKYPNFYS